MPGVVAEVDQRGPAEKAMSFEDLGYEDQTQPFPDRRKQFRSLNSSIGQLSLRDDESEQSGHVANARKSRPTLSRRPASLMNVMVNSQSDDDDDDENCALRKKHRPTLARKSRPMLGHRSASLKNVMHTSQSDADDEHGQMRRPRLARKPSSLRNLFQSQTEGRDDEHPKPRRRISRGSSLRGLFTGQQGEKEPVAAEPDIKFFQLINLNPSQQEQLALYDDEAVRKHIKRNPDSVRARYGFKIGRATEFRYPLSALISLGASLEVVKLAMKAFPDALQSSRDVRSTPLHAACSSARSSLEVVKCIYKAYPDAIQESTHHVFLPLHNACQAEPSCSLEVIQFLAEAFPIGLTKITKLGDTPLRIAERNACISEEIVDYLKQETARVFEQNEELMEERVRLERRQSWGRAGFSKACADQEDSFTGSTTNTESSSEDEADTS